MRSEKSRLYFSICHSKFLLLSLFDVYDEHFEGVIAFWGLIYIIYVLISDGPLDKNLLVAGVQI